MTGFSRRKGPPKRSKAHNLLTSAGVRMQSRSHQRESVSISREWCEGTFQCHAQRLVPLRLQSGKRRLADDDSDEGIGERDREGRMAVQCTARRAGAGVMVIEWPFFGRRGAPTIMQSRSRRVLGVHVCDGDACSRFRSGYGANTRHGNADVRREKRNERNNGNDGACKRAHGDGKYLIGNDLPVPNCHSPVSTGICAVDLRIFGTLSYPEVAGDPGNPIWPSLAFTKFGSNRKMKEDRPPAMPAWVKWLAVLLVTLLLAAGLLATFGGGNHGPGRHFTTEQG